jgi:hypothetical protein
MEIDEERVSFGYGRFGCAEGKQDKFRPGTTVWDGRMRVD